MARRAHSTAEIREKLQQRAQEAADVQPVLDQLQTASFLDDRRFAFEFARFRAHTRGLGRFRIARELRRRGIDQNLIASTLEEIFPGEEEEAALVRRRLERKLRHKRPPYSMRQFRSLYAGLLRAGFSSDIIRNELFRRQEFAQARSAFRDTAVEEEDEVG